MINLFTPSLELKIGRIVEVCGNALKIELDIMLNELTRSINGRVYPIGQMGSIIKIHFGRKVLFGHVRMLRMQSEISLQENLPIAPGDDTRILEADLFAQGQWNESLKQLSLERGVETYPLPLQDCFLCLNTELEEIYKGAESAAQEKAVNPMIPIGHYIGSAGAICRANCDKMFSHHLAILGSTGSGKSGTVASILHSILEHQSDSTRLQPGIIVIDPHGEYTKAFGNRAVVFRAYDDAAANEGDSVLLKLPYWLMSGDEFRSLVIGMGEYEATSQNNIVYEALSYARMVQAGIIESVGANPLGGTIPKLKVGKTEENILSFDRDKPRPFKLLEFLTHIHFVQGRKSNSAEFLATSSRDKHDSILKKLRVLRSNPQMNFMMDELADPPISLQSILSQLFVAQGGKDLKIIDISGLPNEAAGPLTALLSRLLFQYKLWQTREQRKANPVLLVCEEAHRYVPNQGEAQYKEAQVAIRRIAKEGRKYGLGQMLVSQRPSDVEGTVLSQCNSWIVLRLTNTNDQEHVSKFLPDSLKGLTNMLPSLTRREALFAGEAAALPSRIRINELSEEKLPDSHDISFAAGWKNPPTTQEELNEVINKWVG